MHYEHQSPGLQIFLHVTHVEDPRAEKRIKTEFGIVAPVALAEVIVYDGHRVVFDAQYGALPNGAIVVMVADVDGAFVFNDEIAVQIIFHAFANDDEDWVAKIGLALVGKECPCCGGDTTGLAEDVIDAPKNRVKFYFEKGEP